LVNFISLLSARRRLLAGRQIFDLPSEAAAGADLDFRAGNPGVLMAAALDVGEVAGAGRGYGSKACGRMTA
jgi:hypothetical protein